MIVVIIAGGSGTRLWPLSTPNHPKHLLKIGDDRFSLLQNTYKRATQIASTVYVVSEAGQIDLVKAQLPELPDNCFIVEPARRGTANCMLAALTKIAEHHEPDEPIAFTHADHYIRDTNGFVHSFRVAEKASRDNGRIVLVGVEPNYAATGFGYIEKGSLVDEVSYVFDVKSFTEKPDYKTATGYVRSGNYLWNGGYFVGSLATFKVSMEQYAPELAKRYETLASTSEDQRQATYLSFSDSSIDYELIEKVPDLLVVPANFDWMDLGSFRDIARAVGSDERGNHLMGNQVEILEVENSLIHNEEQKPVAVIGLDNIVVINTAEGLLVTRKDLSQNVGDVSKKFYQ